MTQDLQELYDSIIHPLVAEGWKDDDPDQLALEFASLLSYVSEASLDNVKFYLRSIVSSVFDRGREAEASTHH